MSVELPAALKGMLNFAAPDSMPGQLAAKLLLQLLKPYKYIAVKQALKTIERLRKDK